MAVVWAFKRLEILNGETGFVDVPDALARELIDAGDAQDPSIGAHELRYIEDSPPQKRKEPAPEKNGPGRPRKAR